MSDEQKNKRPILVWLILAWETAQVSLSTIAVAWITLEPDRFDQERLAALASFTPIEYALTALGVAIQIIAIWQLYRMRASAALSFAILFLLAAGWYLYYAFLAPSAITRLDAWGALIAGAIAGYVEHLRRTGALSTISTRA